MALTSRQPGCHESEGNGCEEQQGANHPASVRARTFATTARRPGRGAVRGFTRSPVHVRPRQRCGAYELAL